MVESTIEPEQSSHKIEARLRSINLSPFELLIVDSVRAWAESVGVAEKSPDRAAMALRDSDGQAIIVLARHITPDMQRGVKDALWAYGFPDEKTQLLDSPESFLEHLVLHEAAHLLLGDATEADCDQWAFDHLTGW